jgi:Ankyrin repeats (3 copies)/Ankyrin repeat
MRMGQTRCWMVATFFCVSPLLAAGADARISDAARAGNTAAVRALLKQKVDVNLPGPDGATALHWVTDLDDVETARLLIAAGADVKVVNRYGVMPLSLACTNGNVAMIDLLLKVGADPNASLPEGETVLMTAARTGKAEAVKLLLAHGADAKKKGNWRGHPLSLSFSRLTERTSKSGTRKIKMDGHHSESRPASIAREISEAPLRPPKYFVK